MKWFFFTFSYMQFSKNRMKDLFFSVRRRVVLSKLNRIRNFQSKFLTKLSAGDNLSCEDCLRIRKNYLSVDSLERR